MKRLIFVVVLATVCGSLGAADSEISFGPGVELTPGFVASDISVGDFDGDGDPDIAFASGLEVRVRWNDGTGTFAVGEPTEVPAGADLLRAGDLDGNGSLDLIVTSQEYWGRGDTVTVLRNDGTGTFQATAVAVEFRPFAGALLADYDGDGDLDLVLSGAWQVWDGFVFLVNDGQGAFTVKQGPGSQSVEDVVCGDVNNDGRPDLVYGGNSVLLGLGSGEFAASIGLPDTYRQNPGVPMSELPNRHSTTLLCDADGDGSLDVIGARGQPTWDGGVKLFRGAGDGTFAYEEYTAGAFFDNGGSRLGMCAVDLDGDGDQDLVGAGIEGFVSVLVNAGDGTFGPARSFRLEPNERSSRAHLIHPADFDGDGRTDLLVSDGLRDAWIFPGGDEVHVPSIVEMTPDEVSTTGQHTLTLRGTGLSPYTEVRLLGPSDGEREEEAKVVETTVISSEEIRVTIELAPVDISLWGAPRGRDWTVGVEEPNGGACHLYEALVVRLYQGLEPEDRKGKLKDRERARGDTFRFRGAFRDRGALDDLLARAGGDLALEFGYANETVRLEIPADDSGWKGKGKVLRWRTPGGQKAKVKLVIDGRGRKPSIRLKASGIDLPGTPEDQVRVMVMIGDYRSSDEWTWIPGTKEGVLEAK